jgi:hypothetical protein
VSKPVSDMAGNTLNTHLCEPRSDTAKSFTAVAKLVDGPWNFLGLSPYIAVAIRYCPFCGIDLEAS